MKKMYNNLKENDNMMKRYLLTLLITLFAFSAKAISYDEASRQAWFLTDKMAYELNLTPEQCDRAYQINLDYLMSLRTPSDLTGYYWQYRDSDLRCILFDWQYNLMRTLDYFFRPVRYYQSAWYYPVLDHYRYGYYYFDRPLVCINYRGGMWRRRGHSDPSPYLSMRPERGWGMRDQYKNRNWLGNNMNPAPRPMPSRPGTRPGQDNKFPYPGNRPDNGRPSTGIGQGNGGRPGNNGGRPNNGRNDSSHSSGNNRPNDNKGGNQQPTFHDPYTNYRQTGSSTPQSGRGGARGVGQVNSGNSGRSGFTPTIQRQPSNQTNRSNVTTNRGNGRSFGGR